MNNSFDNWKILDDAFTTLCKFMNKEPSKSLVTMTPHLQISSEGAILMDEVKNKLNLVVNTAYFHQWKQYQTTISLPSGNKATICTGASKNPGQSELLALAQAAALYQNGEPTVTTVGNYTYFTKAQ